MSNVDSGPSLGELPEGPWTGAFNRAEGFMMDGNRLEHKGSSDGLAGAIASYRSAFEVLSAQLPIPNLPLAEAHRRLGLARMNEGNAWMKRSTQPAAEGCIEKATTAYEAAIEWLEKSAAASHAVGNPTALRDRNTLGAAWMNLGHALHTRGDLDGVERALLAFDSSLGWLRSLPLQENEWYRLNLAGAESNRANALLSRFVHRGANGSAPPFAAATSAALRADLIAARENALRAVSALEDIERTRADAADLGLKARRALCDALGELLPRAGADLDQMSALADEAVDVAESGLALYRAWPRYTDIFEPIALRLYRFGATVYRIHQPHFLAEFLDENGKWDSEPWREIARDEIGHARHDLQHVRHFTVGDRDSERRLETGRTLTDLIKKFGLK